MTGQDMIDEIRDYEFDDLTDVRLLSFLNDQYQDINSRFLWPYLLTSSTITTDSSGNFTLPADYKAMHSLYQTDDIYERNLLGNSNNFLSEPTGFKLSPLFYSTTLGIKYYKTPADLTALTSPIFPSRYHPLVILGALKKAYYMTDDTNLGQIFERQYEERIRNMAFDLLKNTVAPRKIVDIYEAC